MKTKQEQAMPSKETQGDEKPATLLGQALALPCGASLKNRIVKSAMSECLGSKVHAPTPALQRLYKTWSEGGTGLLISGNVMIDGRALGEPGNVVVEDERHLASLTKWAEAGTQEGTHLWMQINHPGKQSPRFLSPETVSPSAVPFNRELSPAFATPRALTEAEIEDLIQRFGNTAALAKKAGFTGVQVHGAHGYLVSQFLSPYHNRREDKWGGSLENRARFVMEIYRELRERVGQDFPISIKLNSADFQEGGFSAEESRDVMQSLGSAGIDMIEVSGGTYEAPAMTGAKMKKRESTIAREGYFLDFVKEARKSLSVPLCVTGGFRTDEGMANALGADAADLIGLARALAICPDLPKRILAGEKVESLVKRRSTGIKMLDKATMLDITWYENQLARMGQGKAPDPNLGAWRSVFMTLFAMGWGAFRTRRARKESFKKASTSST